MALQISIHPSLSQRKQFGVADAVLLQASQDGQVGEDAFVQNLKVRFNADTIYTSIGEVIVSVNPFKPLNGMYGQEATRLYRGKAYFEVPPHLFALTDTAYRDALNQNRDQCVIISGESGAGKTEAAKQILQYIANISSSAAEVDRVKDVLLKSNPILESFGNAKTNRNNNSSRFGKYQDIAFNFNGEPVGGQIKNYLLEKSRVVHLSQGERNFHIMYQLIDSKLPYLKLNQKPETYNYLKQSGCFKVPAINDMRDFQIVMASLKGIGFTDSEMASMFKTCAGILHLGNVEFVTDANNPDQADVKSNIPLELAAQMFGTTSAVLKNALIIRTVASKREAMETIQNIDQATYSRDAIAKAVYYRLFDWIVNQINGKIKFEDSSRSTKHIGCLDVYGFEVFSTGNGFEQFSINYCNEKLQQLFISLTLKQEQEEYRKEGIEWTEIKYFNNAVILDLIENTKYGIISTLDEECLRPGAATDKSFLDKMDSRYSVNRADYSLHYESKATNRSDKELTQEQFRLKHYAGDVCYTVNGFMDKNMDNLSRDIKAMFTGSKDAVLAVLFPEVDQQATKRMVTTATTFKNSLNELVQILLSKQQHYVRCIKSNDKQAAGVFDETLVRHQVRYLGLLENVRVRRAGFVYRSDYARFLYRYRLLCPKTWSKYSGTPQSGTELILKYMKVDQAEYRTGKSKIFIRKPDTLFMLEERREDALPRIATKIQASWRGHIQYIKYKKIKSAIKILTFYRKRKWSKFFAQYQKLFQNVQQKPDLGKSIQWPAVKDVSLKAGADNLVKVYKNWRAEQMIKKLTPDQVDSIRSKVIAYSIFSGKKIFGFNRPFKGDYLAESLEPSAVKKYDAYKKKLFSDSSNGSKILFSCVVQKSSRKGKGMIRYLILTDRVFTLVHEDFSFTKPPCQIADLQSISLTPKKDQLVIIHRAEGGGDFILDLSLANTDASGEKYSELVTMLQKVKISQQKTKIPVSFVDKSISTLTLSGALDTSVEGGLNQDSNALFKKSKGSLVALYK